MKTFIHRYSRQLAAGAVCLLLALALAAGSWAVLRGSRRQPEAPSAGGYPGLNIDQVSLRYDPEAAQTDGVGGGAGDSDTSRAEENAPEEPPEEPEADEPEEPEQPDADTDAEQDAQEPDDREEDGAPAEEPEDGALTEDEAGPKIATDLDNGTISQDALTDDLYRFSAGVVGGDEDMYLRVRIRNSQTTGRWLSASDGEYAAKLALGRNEITLLLKKGAEVVGEVTYVINYQASMATEEEPEKGSTPPKLKTTLDNASLDIKNRNLSVTVWATDAEDAPIYQDHIEVRLDGSVITQYTGSGDSGLEYRLSLPAAGTDKSEHILSILVWDGKGNSTRKTYHLNYEPTAKGEKIGAATVRLDLSVLGLGVIEAPVSCDIFQDVPASYAVKTVLEQLGYKVEFEGSLDSGFYLTRISRARTFSYAAVPEELQRLLELDGLSLSRPSGYKNSVGEFDYTMASGWMYSINGLYPGKGLSEYFLSDGDTLTIRFTLAYGKDIGSGSGAQGGALKSYCGRWIDGSYIPSHTYKDGVCTVCGAADPDGHTHQETEQITRAATCTEAGERTLTCTVCGASRIETIPAAGHSWSASCRQTADGCTVTAYCTVCGLSHTETTGTVETIQYTVPTCTAEGSATYRASVTVDGQTVTAETTVTLERLAHTYDESGVCTGCGQTASAGGGEQETEHEEQNETT